MATAGDNVIKTDHVIIWLDENMGVKGNYESSKKILDKNANLDRPIEGEYLPEIDDLIFSINPELNNEKFEDLIKSPLRMFIDEIECIKCINDNIAAKKNVFLITSGRKGQLIVPKIDGKLPGPIYIFCGDRNKHEEWARTCQTEIIIHDDEKGVFARVLSDIGVHYLKKCEVVTLNDKDIHQYFAWARRLFMSATKLDQGDRQGFLDYARAELAERNISISDGNDSDCQIGEAADEH